VRSNEVRSDACAWRAEGDVCAAATRAPPLSRFSLTARTLSVRHCQRAHLCRSSCARVAAEWAESAVCVAAPRVASSAASWRVASSARRTSCRHCPSFEPPPPASDVLTPPVISSISTPKPRVSRRTVAVVAGGHSSAAVVGGSARGAAARPSRRGRRAGSGGSRCRWREPPAHSSASTYGTPAAAARMSSDNSSVWPRLAH
jgi:hypothetical protein